MTNKPPTDAAIIKGFEKFEQGFNVWMAEYRNTIPDKGDAYVADSITMWHAHEAYRRRALAAQERIDQKKGKGGS